MGTRSHMRLWATQSQNAAQEKDRRLHIKTWAARARERDNWTAPAAHFQHA